MTTDTDQDKPADLLEDQIPKSDSRNQIPDGTEGDPIVDPPAPPGRPPRQRRGRTTEEPQGSFGDEVVPEEAMDGLLAALRIRRDNKEAASVYAKADKEVKKRMTELGYYDGKPHNVRCGTFLLCTAKSDAEPTHIDFERLPSIRLTVSEPSPDK